MPVACVPENAAMTRYIFVTGGVLSSLGKGITSASLGCLLESRGLKITLQKIDPYINVDPGTMNPFQHGEVYVTEDGAETDLDLGHYERFTSLTMGKRNNFTAGQIYNSIINREREGGYLGTTVQVVPHVTDEIKEWIRNVARGKKLDVVIVEIGGTVGDIEGLPFLEAARQLRQDVGRENCLYVHVTLVPYIKSAREIKTKPTQHSVARLREIGIQPDILLCRSEQPVPREAKRKIALFCNVEEKAVFEAVDVDSIYEVPIVFQRQGLDRMIMRQLGLSGKRQDLSLWKAKLRRLKSASRSVPIAVVGKYTGTFDSYKSINEALVHAGIASHARVDIKLVDAEEIERRGAGAVLKGFKGILVPGAFGVRGIEGKIAACRHARQKRIPFLGICMGMQCAVTEFARGPCGLKRASSSEIAPSAPHPVIDLLPEQKKIRDKGGTMRLGAYPCNLKPGSRAAMAYRKKQIQERHRHRYEFNMSYRMQFDEAGLVISGISPDGRLVEIIELADHPWFVGTQFHPEFKSRLRSPHPLFRNFVRAALGKL